MDNRWIVVTTTRKYGYVKKFKTRRCAIATILMNKFTHSISIIFSAVHDA